MNEKILAKMFSEELDQLAQGNPEPNKTEFLDEYAEEVKLVEAILREDFSRESSIREDLKKRLLDKFNTRIESGNQQNKGFNADDELSEEDLDFVAGGHSLKEESGCTKCGCKRSRATITTAICPDCGHNRDDHM